jgi:hypothetical protein
LPILDLRLKPEIKIRDPVKNQGVSIMAGIYEADQVLKVAEVGDTIFIAQSDKVPFSRLLKRGKKPTNMLSSWPVQVYPDRGFTGTLDGTDMTSFNHTNREQIEAYGMWLRTEGWMVSRLAEATKTWGVKGSEKAKQAKDDALILGQMIEKKLLDNSEMAVESGATPYNSRGAYKWLSPTAQTVKPVPANYRPATACAYTDALADFKATSMEGMLEAAASQKKEAVDLTGYVGIKLKTQMSGWAQKHVEDVNTAQALQRYNMDAEDKKLIRVVDFFEFDAGKVKVFPSYYLLHTAATGAATANSTRSGLFLDMEMWELCFLDQPTSWVEPPKSGGPRGYHDAVFLLKCLNPTGQCYVNCET